MGFGSFAEAKKTSWINLTMLIADKVSTDYESNKEKDKDVKKPKTQAEELAAMSQIL